MSDKTIRLMIVLLAFLFGASFAVISVPAQALAAQQVEVTSNSCLTCHENLYYLHDSGCWYCMTDAHKYRCTDCHEGNSTAIKEEDAHFGVLPHPQENDGAKCKQCHTEGLQARIDIFAVERGGFETVVEPVAYVPTQSVETGFPETAQPTLAEKLPWVAGAFVLFGLWLALVRDHQ